MSSADRCPDCGLAVSLHFRVERGDSRRSDTGQFLGCPASIRTLAQGDSRPRVTLRVCTRGTRGGLTSNRKGHVLVAWADYQTAAGEILIWDLETGDQWMGSAEEHTRSSRRLTGPELERAQTRVEDVSGGPVQVIVTPRRLKEDTGA